MDHECDSKPLDLPCKHISDAALRLDDLGRARVLLQLAPEAKNLDVDAAVEDVFMHPGGLQKMLPAERALRSVQEGDKQRVFPFGQRNVRAIRIGKPSGAKIELPAGKPIAAAFWLPCR
jgi:hypothetical protein